MTRPSDEHLSAAARAAHRTALRHAARRRWGLGSATAVSIALVEFMGVAPTGKRMEKVDEVYFLRVRDSKFVEFWGMEDNLGRLRQLGIDPSSIYREPAHGGE